MTQTEVKEIIDPISQELVSRENVDELCAALERAKQDMDRIGLFRRQCIEALSAIATGDANTRRVRGTQYEAKIVAPGRYFDQSQLRSVANAYPQFVNEYLRVERYAVNLTPYKKLANTTATDPAFATFKKMITEAEREPTALPTVTVEHLGEG